MQAVISDSAYCAACSGEVGLHSSEVNEDVKLLVLTADGCGRSCICEHCRVRKRKFSCCENSESLDISEIAKGGVGESSTPWVSEDVFTGNGCAICLFVEYKSDEYLKAVVGGSFSVVNGSIDCTGNVETAHCDGFAISFAFSVSLWHTVK